MIFFTQMTLMVWCLSTLEFCLCICSDKLIKSEKHKVSMGQHLKVSIVNRPRKMAVSER